MITGRKAFTGDSRSNVVAAILRDEPPPMSTIQPVTPPALDVLVRTCLAKDPDARLQSAHDVAQQLRWIRDGVLRPASIASTSHRLTSRAALASVALLTAIAVWFLMRPRPQAPVLSSRFAIVAPPASR